MSRPTLPRVLVVPFALALSGCVRPPAHTPAPQPLDGGLALRDSASVRRSCLAPDSVLAGLRLCELRSASRAGRPY